MKFMSYNIRHGLGNDGDVNLSRIASIIRAVDPDVVALQELDVNWVRSGRIDQPSTLSTLLGMHACFGANLHAPGTRQIYAGSEFGTMLLSRFPIVEWSNIPFPAHDGWEARSLLHTVVDVPGAGEMVCLNTHLQVNGSGTEGDASCQRLQAAAVISRHVAVDDRPVVLMGDMNCQPGDPELGPVMNELTDAWVSGGDGTPRYTIPACPD